MICPNYNLERLQLDQLTDLARFVVLENFKHHSNCIGIKNQDEEIKDILTEELNYFENAQIFVFRDLDQSIIGSIRVLRWNYLDVLPLQKIFNIDCSLLNNEMHKIPIWHIGRFAIRKGIRNIHLFKMLMVCAITSVCENKNAMAYAECDSKLLKVLWSLGINARPISTSKHYLGSETIPVCMAQKDLIDFYNKNKSLVQIGFLNQNVFDKKHQLV